MFFIAKSGSLGVCQQLFVVFCPAVNCATNVRFKGLELTPPSDMFFCNILQLKGPIILHGQWAVYRTLTIPINTLWQCNLTACFLVYFSLYEFIFFHHISYIIFKSLCICWCENCAIHSTWMAETFREHVLSGVTQCYISGARTCSGQLSITWRKNGRPYSWVYQPGVSQSDKCGLNLSLQPS